jgi:hypothetical protein
MKAAQKGKTLEAFLEELAAAVKQICQRGDQCVTSPQNAAEFWNVCPRPRRLGEDWD